jgi:hypothetical protein
MQLLIPNPTDNAVTIFRRVGYTFQREESGEMSFIRPLATAGYPRFHCYVKPHPEGFLCSIHLDQKRETYGNTTRHHGEYTDDGALAEEVERIESLIGTLTRIA